MKLHGVKINYACHDSMCQFSTGTKGEERQKLQSYIPVDRKQILPKLSLSLSREKVLLSQTLGISDHSHWPSPRQGVLCCCCGMSLRKVEREGSNAFSRRIPERTSAKPLLCHPFYHPARSTANLCP